MARTATYFTALLQNKNCEAFCKNTVGIITRSSRCMCHALQCVKNKTIGKPHHGTFIHWEQQASQTNHHTSYLGG